MKQQQTASVLRRMVRHQAITAWHRLGPPLLAFLDPQVTRHLDPALLEQLPPDIVACLVPVVLERFNPSVLEQLEPAVLEQLSPTALERLSPAVLEQLPPATLEQLSPTVLERLSLETLEQLSPDVLTRLTPAVVEQLLPEIIVRLHPDILVHLAPDVLAQLPPEIIVRLHPDILVHLAPDVLAQLPPETLEQLSPATLEQLPPTILEQLPPTALERLPPTALERLSPATLEQLPPATLEQLPPATLERLPPTMLEQIDPTLLPPLGYTRPRADVVYGEAFRRCIEYITGTGIQGHILEFGTLRGYTARLMATLMQQFRYPGALYLYDSFEGLPEITSPVDQASYEVRINKVWFQGSMALEEEMPDRIFRVLSKIVPPEQIHITKGFFEETLATALPAGKAALIHVDCDMYTSTVTVLEQLLKQDLLQDGCVLLFDDYNCNRANPAMGERRAFAEVFGAQERFSYSPFFPYGWHGQAFFVHDHQPPEQP